MPEYMHLILISRVKPRLSLERLAMKEELIRIGPAELRFQKEEIAGFYQARGFFSDFLLKRLREKDAATIQRLQALAARWYQDNGFAAEAIECYLKGKRYAEAAALVEVHGGPLVRGGRVFPCAVVDRPAAGERGAKFRHAPAAGGGGI